MVLMAMVIETRDATWEWFEQNIDKILERVPEARWGQMTTIGSAFCGAEKKKEIDDFFVGRIDEMAGGPRNLAKTLEGIDLCIAKAQHHQAEMEAWLGQ